MKRILILGHSGFVGNNLFHFLLKKYHHIEIIGKSSQDIDLTNEEQTEKLKEYFDLDTVVIMTSGIKSNYGNDLSTFHNNGVMAENVCKILSTHPVKKFIFFSSIAVYGVDSNNTAITENTPVMTDSYYGLSKYISEKLLTLEFSKHKDSSLIILRTPTIYGSGEKIKAATPSGFLITSLDGQEVTLWGDGSELREFLFIDDLLKTIDLLIFSDFSGILNIGDGVGNSYKESLTIISKFLGKELTVHSKPRSKEKVDKVYDNSLFLRLFPGFSFTPLEKGLQTIIDAHNSKEKRCNLCQQKSVTTLLDLGLQPISNNFLQNAAIPKKKFPLRFGQCQSCGLAQLTQVMPVEELTPLYDWITYAEPEEHLDSLAAAIKNLGLNHDSKMCGISFKDTSLLERMDKLGFNNTLVFDPQHDLGIDANGGIEKIQSALTLEKARRIVQQYSQFDVVIARHILEHTYNLTEFIAALKELTAPGGYLVIEVPDCARAFERNDYPIIWEEHLSYFTPATFHHLFQYHGLDVIHQENVPYALENSLIAISRKIDNEQTVNQKQAFLPQDRLQQEKERVQHFAASMEMNKDLLHHYLSQFKNKYGKIALLGAGHLACAFINYLDLKKYIDCVIDDNPQKNGLLLPGSLLPIHNSAAFVERGITLCLLSVNPRSEDYVIEKNRSFTDNGGTFFSIFSQSDHALPPLKEIGSLEKKNEEVFIAKDEVIKITPSSVQFVKKKALHNLRKRARICFHKDSSSLIHEMLIALTNECYIRPHKHTHKSESFHVIEGEIDVIIFNDDGTIKETIRLSDYNSGKKFYYRLSEPLYHTVVIKSAVAVFHETTNGPFNREETIFAPWAPEEGDNEGIKKFNDKLNNHP